MSWLQKTQAVLAWAEHARFISFNFQKFKHTKLASLINCCINFKFKKRPNDFLHVFISCAAD